MNLIRRFQAGLYTRRLQGTGSAAELTQAKDHLLALGPAAIRSLFDGLAKGKSAAPSVDVLTQLLTHETLGVYIEALRSPVPAVVEASSEAMSRSTSYDPTQLLSLFSDSSVSKARLESILSAQMERIQPVTMLRVLPDLSKDARGSVFRLIEKRADASVVPDTLRMATHVEWWLRLHAVKLLARFPSADGVAGVAKLLKDENAAVRLEAVRTLSALKAIESIPALCSRLRDIDIKVQSAAIEALIAIGDATAVPHLLDYLKDESEYVRRGAVEVLNQVVTVDAIKDLVGALRDSDWWVRVRAADALGTLGGTRVIDAVIELVSDPDDFIRRYAVEILNTVPDRRAVEALIIALEDTDWWVRERAIDALAKMGDGRAVEPLLRVLARDTRALPLCVRALAQIGDARAVEPLCRLAASESADVRRETLVALTKLSRLDLPAESKTKVIETLHDAGVLSDRSAPPPMEVRGLGPDSGRQDNGHRGTPSRGVDGIEQGRAQAPQRLINFQKLDPGTVLIDRFRVLQRVGGGGFGTVYLVEDVIVREELVLKVLSPQLSLDDNMIRRFVQELRLSRRITHRNVIRIYDLIDLNGAHAISMEHFGGRDLGTVLKQEGPLSVDRVMHVTEQVLEGLTAAHDLGIIHRDLKPANLLLSDTELVKIVDFGLASVGQGAKSRLTQSGILVGTPEYISPEQITGHDVDARTDLYSLGAVLYELLSGRQAFQGANAVNVLFQHLEADIPALNTVAAGIPDAINELVMRCMSRFPDDRPKNARAMLEMLRHVA